MLPSIIVISIVLGYLYLRLNYLNKTGVLDNEKLLSDYVKNKHELRTLTKLTTTAMGWLFLVWLSVVMEPLTETQTHVFASAQFIFAAELLLLNEMINRCISLKIDLGKPMPKKLIYVILIDILTILTISTLSAYHSAYILVIVLYILLTLSKIKRIDNGFLWLRKIIQYKNGV